MATRSTHWRKPKQAKGVSYAELGVAPTTVEEETGEDVRIHRYVVGAVMETLLNIAVKAANGQQPTDTIIDPFPLFRAYGPASSKIRTSSTTSSRAIAVVVTNVSAACEVLHRNFAGSRIVLHAPDFPELWQAIERSVRDEDLIG
ncbi:hypothetical protein BDN70DRAFT_901676 [Pholiota conissans]|uniref:Uncharacterized protein n=1 Tax=Pholiota conissans TaxID=109636 RepID=A0A9P6CLD8_9AGAR|nr:hypothetical protein BDN70DRAFT_901676 [Pholiota conissans]